MPEESARGVPVPGAEYQECHYLDDLTTERGKKRPPYTNPTDWMGLHAKAKEADNPAGVPGLQIDGYFPDDSTTTIGNPYGKLKEDGTTKKYPHDSQFVIRFPNPRLWNGKLVITGSMGVRGQYASDFIVSDYVLSKGYAFASTDKGNSGGDFHLDGAKPGGALAEWHRRTRELALAAKAATAEYYGKDPSRTYITGISNGGYLTRYALEKTPELYDGGVDWEGVLWLPEGPNLFTFLPPAIKNYPTYADQTRPKAERNKAYKAIIAAGFERDSEFAWEHHYNYYWKFTQQAFRKEFDPTYEGLEDDYDYAKRIDPKENPRAQEVREAVESVSLTGNIGRRLITLHGTLDALIPKRNNSDVYANLVRKAGNSHLHRYYEIKGGTHLDSLYDQYPDKVRPMLPLYRAAFEALEKWVEKGIEPSRIG